MRADPPPRSAAPHGGTPRRHGTRSPPRRGPLASVGRRSRGTSVARGRGLAPGGSPRRPAQRGGPIAPPCARAPVGAEQPHVALGPLDRRQRVPDPLVGEVTLEAEEEAVLEMYMEALGMM